MPRGVHDTNGAQPMGPSQDGAVPVYQPDITGPVPNDGTVMPSTPHQRDVAKVLDPTTGRPYNQ